MIKETLKNFHFPYLTCVGLLIFLAVFLSVLYWVFKKENKKLYDYTENLPFAEDN